MIIPLNIELLHSYIKDLSLEVLDPVTLAKEKNDSDNIVVEISPLNIKHRDLNNSIYEVIAECKVLIKNTSLDSKEQKLLALQLEYGGLFNLNLENQDEDILMKMIYVDCANILYPFLRAEIATLSTKAGINAILLPYINFENQFNELRKHSQQPQSIIKH